MSAASVAHPAAVQSPYTGTKHRLPGAGSEDHQLIDDAAEGPEISQDNVSL